MNPQQKLNELSAIYQKLNTVISDDELRDYPVLQHLSDLIGDVSIQVLDAEEEYNNCVRGSLTWEEAIFA